MSSNQKVVQSYLDRHGVSKLFEDMMASLIKEMPNEPIMYLIKILQKRLKKKNTNSPLSPPASRGMGLTGSSIPKKFTPDPQVILPGSKAVTSAYGKFDTDSLRSEDNLRSSKDRNYEKPWQVNTKAAKGIKSKKDPHGEVWDGETKVHGVEEIFEQNTKNVSPLTRSLPLPASKKDTSWKETSPRSKDKKVISSVSTKTPSTTRITTSISDEELMMDTRAQTPESIRKQTLSPHEYSRVKRHSSKKKAVMQKRKLQALLSNEDSQRNKQENLDSTDDEAVDIIESMHDLQCEGVTSKSSGYKHAPQRQQQQQNMVSSNVTVGVCSRCARVIDDKKTPSTLHRLDSYSDGEIESVSQIDTAKPFRPKWPVLTDSEGETQVEEEKMRPKSIERVSFRTLEEKSEKSDFFDGNSPLRKKTKQFAAHTFSDSESAATFTTSTKKDNKTNRSKLTSSPKKTSGRHAWKQQNVDSNSDEEIVKNTSFSKGAIRSSGGFNLKDAGGDDDSDFS